MKLGSVTKLDKRNKATSKNDGDNVMSENYDVIFIFPIYEQFGAIVVTFTKTTNRIKKSLRALNLLLE